MQNQSNKERMEKWGFQSPETPGFHEVIIPGKADCKAVYIYRLNLPKHESYTLNSGELELHPVLLSGSAQLTDHSSLTQKMERFDSFYIPGGNSVKITALEDCVFYIGGAKYEGIGSPFFRKYDPSLPIGDIHQIHGQGVGQREVMFTLDPKTPASRIIAGLTWGGQGAWTSWPPHQHEKYLEEAYCYFDMPLPKFGFHVSYLQSGDVEDIVTHTVHGGSMVLAPCGYHPTVASPSVRNTYFWVLAAFEPDGRSYEKALEDPALTQYKG